MHAEQMCLTMSLNAHSSILLQALLLVLYSECFLGHALLVDQSSVAAATRPLALAPAPLTIQTRSRRKVPDSVDTSSPVEYMTRLRDSLTDSNGRPRTEETDPTNVWCLLDKDLLEGTHRLKHPSVGKCRVAFQFHFNMRALSEFLMRKTVTVQKGILRSYVDTIPRYFQEQTTIPVQITAELIMSVLRDNTTQSAYAGQTTISVSTNSSGWIELNVTDGLQFIHSHLVSSVSPDIKLTLILTVDCLHNRKVPISIIDPASIPLSQGPRRLRLSKLQPMLLVYLNDELIREEIHQREEKQVQGQENLNASNLDRNSREKRGQVTNGCHRDDFVINFHNIDLVYVLAPYEYNARQCTGSCSHTILRRRGSIATNHAKIMASAVALKEYNPRIPLQRSPTEPCCTPIKYESISLLIVDDVTEFNYAVYPTMSVSQCGCR